MKKPVKKLVSLLLALSLLLGCASALAGDTYPAEKVSYERQCGRYGNL